MTNFSELFPSGGLRLLNSQIFTSSGTWTKPANAVLVRVILCGGGGSGRRPAANAAASSGGGAAPIVDVSFPAAALGATESVTVGAGGTAISTTGTDGNAGGHSAFGSIIEAAGGSAGTSSATGMGGSQFYPGNLSVMINTTARTASVATVANAAPGSSTTGGAVDGAFQITGGGGGITGANNSSPGGAGGAKGRYRVTASPFANATSGTGGTTGGATGGNGGTGADGDIRLKLGGEGGGAGGGGTTTGGNGGAGGAPGGGGGAGGFGTTTSGNSGAGGDGRVYVETWG